MSGGKMIGREYRHPKLGRVVVMKQLNYKAGGPRNVLVRNRRGDETVVPQRSLRRSTMNKELELWQKIGDAAIANPVKFLILLAWQWFRTYILRRGKC